MKIKEMKSFGLILLHSITVVGGIGSSVWNVATEKQNCM